MAIVVRLGPLALQRRRAARIAELERIFGSAVELIEVFTVAELVTVVGTADVVAVALDASPPEQLTEAVAAVGSLPVLRPLWRRQRNTRGEIDEVFDGYGLLTAVDIVTLADGELSTT
jgi:hypothetical protein